MEEKYQKIKNIIEKELEKMSDAGHDIKHVLRVYRLCLKLARGAKVNLEVLKLAALFHDIGGPKELRDKTGRICHARESAKIAYKILKNLKYPQEIISKVTHCIVAHRYKTGVRPKTKEAKILFDADKLDAIGAIGIARAFIWTGKNNAQMYSDISLKRYIKENIVGGKLNGRIKNKTKHSPFFEFELKLKRLPGKLHTLKTKKIGKQKVAYMKTFFTRLRKEIEIGDRYN